MSREVVGFFVTKQMKKLIRALLLPVCFTTEQSTVEASLFVKYKKNDYNQFYIFLKDLRILDPLPLLIIIIIITRFSVTSLLV